MPDQQFVNIAVTDITPNPNQPRKEFDEAELLELADSIKEHGVIQPLIVEERHYTDDEIDHHAYTLLAGERRLRAAKIAGLTEVPCVVRADGTGDQYRLELALIENVQRADLKPAEEARAYQQLHDLGLSDEAIGARVGKARSTIANLRRLVELPAPILEKIGDGDKELPLRYARSLIPVARLDAQAAQEIATETIDAEPNEREDVFENALQETLRQTKQARELGSKVPFDLKWNPKASAVLDGAEVALPACAGCELALQVDYQRYCLRPACLDAKIEIYVTAELKRVAKATGIAIAAQGEKTDFLPREPGEWSEAVTGKKLLALKHESLRLVKSLGGDWRNNDVTGSKIVRLATTDPEALAKAAGFKTLQPASPTAGRDTYEQQRQAHHAAEERISQAVALVAPAFAKIWPDTLPLLRRLVAMDFSIAFITEEIASAINAKTPPTLAACQLALSCWLISNAIMLPWGKGDARVAQKPIEELARELKVKLPKGWEAALVPPKPEKKSEPAQKSATKKATR